MIVGYTTGAFDLFHVGHVNLLRNARSLCDRLIVGVSTDKCLQSYKRKPVIPYEDRAAIVRACRYADVVIPQTDMNKREAVERLKPDFLFIGDDWFERYSGEQLGVRIVYLPYTRKVSTTLLIKETRKPLTWPEAMTLNLLDMATVLESLRIPYWLDGGALLGAVRDGEFPEGDHDVDLSTWMEYLPQHKDIINTARAMGFICDCQYGPPGAQLQFCRYGLGFDIWFKTRDGDTAWWCIWPSPDNGGPLFKRVPTAFYDNLGVVEFKGRKFPAPGDTEGYLTLRYGDWRTPVSDADYNPFQHDNAIVGTTLEG